MADLTFTRSLGEEDHSPSASARSISYSPILQQFFLGVASTSVGPLVARSP